MKHLHAMIPATYIILRKGNQILLSRRHNTGFSDGMFSLPAGHVEEGETFSLAAIREAKEEIGVAIAPADLKPLHIKQQSRSDGHPGIAVFFLVEHWQGEPFNVEPNKCSELLWADLTDLPHDLLHYVKVCVERGLKGDFYSEW